MKEQQQLELVKSCFGVAERAALAQSVENHALCNNIIYKHQLRIFHEIM